MRVEAQSPPSGFAFSPVIRMLGLFEAARANLMAAKIAQQDSTVTFDAIGIDFKELHSEHERLSVEHVRERRARQFQGMPVGKGFAHPIETLPRISDSSSNRSLIESAASEIASVAPEAALEAELLAWRKVCSMPECPSWSISGAVGGAEVVLSEPAARKVFVL